MGDFMKILHISNRLAELDGGPPQGILTQAKAQADLGDDVAIFPCSSSGGKPIIEPGCYGRLKVFKTPTNASLKFPKSVVYKALLDVVGDYDIVHIHGSWRYHLIAAAKAAKAKGVPYIISPEGDLGGIPRRNKWYLKRPYFLFIEKKYFQNATAIHCYTNKEVRELRDIQLSPRHFVVPQPVEDSLTNVEPDMEAVSQVCPGMQNGDPMIFYLGRILWIKRLPLLLEAFIKISREFERSHLVLAGPWEDTNMVETIKASANKMGLEKRVHLPGMVRGGLKVGLLNRATVFVLPSSHENFGISAAEALLFGKCCIVSDGVALADDISQAQAGIVFKGDSTSLAAALKKVLSEETFRKACDIAAKGLSGKFSPECVARKFREEYDICIKHHHSL